MNQGEPGECTDHSRIMRLLLLLFLLVAVSVQQFPECQSTADCAPGHYCSKHRGEGYCVPTRRHAFQSNETYCFYNLQCGDNRYCARMGRAMWGRCKPKPSESSRSFLRQCFEDSQCGKDRFCDKHLHFCVPRTGFY